MSNNNEYITKRKGWYFFMEPRLRLYQYSCSQHKYQVIPVITLLMKSIGVHREWYMSKLKVTIFYDYAEIVDADYNKIIFI